MSVPNAPLRIAEAAEIGVRHWAIRPRSLAELSNVAATPSERRRQPTTDQRALSLRLSSTECP
jgi:hypothetical protein